MIADIPGQEEKDVRVQVSHGVSITRARVRLPQVTGD